MSDDLRVDDLIIQNLSAARDTVADVLNISNFDELVQWNAVISSMRGLPEQAMKELGGPLIEKIFNAFGKDPKKKEDRMAMLPFQDIIALSLQDCMQILVNNMNRQHQAQAALRAGQGGLLKG